MAEGLTISNVKVQFPGFYSYLEVGQALKQRSIEGIRAVAKQNLIKVFKSGGLKYALDFFGKYNLNLFQLNSEIQSFHNNATGRQFHGVEQFLNRTVNHYEVNKAIKNISDKLLTFQTWINDIRSAVLGLPNLDYSIAIKEGNDYQYITSNMLNIEEDFLKRSMGYANKNSLVRKEKQTIKAIADIREMLKEDKFFIDLSAHFSNLMHSIPKKSDPPSTPQVKWAAEVFEKHIQETGEKASRQVPQPPDDESHWDVNWFWSNYHLTHASSGKKGTKTYRKYKEFKGFTSSGEGGDVNQTQVKSINMWREGNAGYFSAANLNVLSDLFSFWQHVADSFRDRNIEEITDDEIDQILSVLLSNEVIQKLGLKTLQKLRKGIK